MRRRKINAKIKYVKYHSETDGQETLEPFKKKKNLRLADGFETALTRDRNQFSDDHQKFKLQAFS